MASAPNSIGDKKAAFVPAMLAVSVTPALLLNPARGMALRCIRAILFPADQEQFASMLKIAGFDPAYAPESVNCG